MHMMIGMKKLSLICLISVLFFTGCGDTQKSVDKKQVDFPSTFKVIEVLKSKNTQLSVEKDGARYTLIMDDKTDVFYNEKKVQNESILKNQTIYVEGKSDSFYAQKIVITEWPGRYEKGPEVIIEAKNVPGIISKYLSQKHPQFGVKDNTDWEPLKKPSNTPSNSRMDLYQNGLYLLIVKYDETKGPKTFTVLLAPSMESEATWSGKIGTDGRISE